MLPTEHGTTDPFLYLLVDADVLLFYQVHVYAVREGYPLN